MIKLYYFDDICALGVAYIHFSPFLKNLAKVLPFLPLFISKIKKVAQGPFSIGIYAQP